MNELSHKIKVLHERAYWEYIRMIDFKRRSIASDEIKLKQAIAEGCELKDDMYKAYSNWSDNFTYTIMELAELENTSFNIERERFFTTHPELAKL